VAYKEGHFSELKVPLTWTVALALVVAAVVAVALLLSDRRETVQTSAYGASRAVTDMIGQPATSALAAPGRWAGAGGDFLRGYLFAAAENRRLRQEVQELRQWRDVAVALQDTNARYKALLGFRTEPPIPMVAARVVLDARGPFSNTRLADAGRERRVQVGNPVMSDRGLVGRVIGVTRGASRVLLLTDVASRTPVLVDRTDARAVLTGDGSNTPRLDYLRGQAPVKDGDRILTSGDGGMFPRGLPIGTAVKGLDGVWRVRLDADQSSIDVVRILLFQDFSQLVDLKDLGTLHVPPAGALGVPGVPGATVTIPAPAAAPPAGAGAPVLSPSRPAQKAAPRPAAPAAPAERVYARPPPAAAPAPAAAPPAAPAAAPASPAQSPPGAAQ
jgi:rod shape-determining protein MreC